MKMVTERFKPRCYSEKHEFYESTAYLESTINFITIRVLPPGLPEVENAVPPWKKFPLNLSTDDNNTDLDQRVVSVGDGVGAETWTRNPGHDPPRARLCWTAITAQLQALDAVVLGDRTSVEVLGTSDDVEAMAEGG